MEKQKTPQKAKKYTQKQFSELGEQFVPLYAVPKGGFFRLNDSYTAPVWVRGDYDRSDNKYSAYQYENVNKESFFKGTRKVWVGFYFGIITTIIKFTERTMNKLEEQMVCAIKNGTDFSMGNTLVRHENGVVSVFLHSNLIAVRNKIGNWLYSDGHYKVRSKTTKSRLNALGLHVFQKNKKWYVGDKKNYVPFVNDFGYEMSPLLGNPDVENPDLENPDVALSI